MNFKHWLLNLKYKLHETHDGKEKELENAIRDFDGKKKELEKELEKAIEDFDLPAVKSLIEKFVTIPATAMFTAAIVGNLQVLKYLIDEKMVKIPYDGVKLAAESGNLDVVKYLCNHPSGAEIGNAVFWAAIDNHLDIVKYLVEEEYAKIHDRTVQSTVLHGHFSIVKYLVEKGANIGKAAKFAEEYGVLTGNTLLSMQMVEYLKEKLKT